MGMGDWDEQIPGSDGGTSANPLRRGRLRDLLMINRTGDETSPETMPSRTGDTGKPEEMRLAHRINDDPLQSKSGGPSVNTPYSDPGQGRLAELMKERDAMDAPTKKPSLLHKIAQVAAPLLTTLAASKWGGMGGTRGAEQGAEEGIQRRHQQEDLAAQNKRLDRQRLSDQIETEARGAEQRTFQHGEDTERNRVTEEGMNLREKMNQERMADQDKRLAEVIKGQSDRQQAGFDQQSDMEDKKQVNRMQLQHAKSEAQAAMARYKTAHPTEQKIPPVLGKSFATYEQSQSRMDVMDKSYKDAIADPGNSQAMLNLLASHLGMTMGLQPGARMNQAIIQEAMKSGYIDERIQAHFGPDGYLTGVVLTPRQMGQMMTLAESRLMEDARAVKDTEAYFGVQGHSAITPRVPGKPGADTGGAGGAGATNATPKAAAVPHKAGEKVTYKGKEYTVESINKDGTLNLK